MSFYRCRTLFRGSAVVRPRVKRLCDGFRKKQGGASFMSVSGSRHLIALTRDTLRILGLLLGLLCGRASVCSGTQASSVREYISCSRCNHMFHRVIPLRTELYSYLSLSLLRSSASANEAFAEPTPKFSRPFLLQGAWMDCGRSMTSLTSFSLVD